MANVSPEMSTVIVIIGLQALIGLFSGVCSIIAFFRRQPPIDQTLTLYARTTDLTLLEERNTRVHAELFQVIRALQSSTDKTFADVQRILGRVEGQLAQMTKGGSNGGHIE